MDAYEGAQLSAGDMQDYIPIDLKSPYKTHWEWRVAMDAYNQMYGFSSDRDAWYYWYVVSGGLKADQEIEGRTLVHWGKLMAEIFGTIPGFTPMKPIGPRVIQNYHRPQLKKSTTTNISKPPSYGHRTPWSEMTATHQRAFKHSYMRHQKDFDLPNFQETNAEHFRLIFNNKVTQVRNAGKFSFFQTDEWVKGVRTTVRRTEPVINGQRYFYYETLEGIFVSAGKMN